MHSYAGMVTSTMCQISKMQSKFWKVGKKCRIFSYFFWKVQFENSRRKQRNKDTCTVCNSNHMINV